MNRIEEKINKIFVDDFHCKESYIKREHLLKEDMLIDSLDKINLAVSLGVAFDVVMYDREMREIKTVGDCYDKLKAKLTKGKSDE